MNRQCTFELCNNPNSEFHPICKNNIHSISALTGLILLIFLFILFALVYFLSNILPSPKNSKMFVAERAQSHYQQLMDIGPRIVGSCENEYLAVNFLKAQLRDIKKNAHENQKLEMSVQVASGAFYSTVYYSMGDSYEMLNSYGNVQSIIVRLKGKNCEKKDKNKDLKNKTPNNKTPNNKNFKRENERFSILINSYFDTSSTSSDIKDSTVMCAVMLEILRVLSKRSERLDNNLIFLFNGAGESSQASKMFISRHKWGRDVKVLINLEGNGGKGGRSGKTLFFHTKCINTCLINYGRKFPHPYGQVIFEEIFMYFKPFDAIENVTIYNFVFLNNQYNFDARIPKGSYQHIGDNLFALLEYLGKAQISTCGKSWEQIIYYDLFGLFMISYTISFSYAINSVVVALSIVLFIKAFKDFSLGFLKSLKFILLTLCALFSGWVFSLAFVTTTVFILHSLEYSKTWYVHSWLMLVLFCIPTILFSSASILFFNSFNSNKGLCISVLYQIQIHSTRLIWTVLLLIGTLMKFRTCYVFLILASFNIFGVLISNFLARKWQIIYLLSSIIPTAFIFYISIATMTIFVSSIGIIGSERISYVFIGVHCVLFTILTLGPYSPLITLVRKPQILLIILFCIFLLGIFFIIIFTPFGFSYSGIWIHHITRRFYDEKGKLYQKDAGFLVSSNGNSQKILQKYLKNFKENICIDRCCDHHLLCGMPLVHSKMANMEQITWIPSASHISVCPVSIKLNSKKISGNSTRFSFTVSGTNHINVYFAPKEHLKLKGIVVNSVAVFNFQDKRNKIMDKTNEDKPNKTVDKTKYFVWKNRTVHFMKHIWGKKSTPLKFSLDIESSSKWIGPMLDIAVTGTHLHEKNETYTEEYLIFLKQFPEWIELNNAFASYVVQEF